MLSKRQLAVLFLLIVPSVAAGDTERVEPEIRADGLIQRFELVPSDQFTFARIKDRAMSDLSRLKRSGHPQLIRISYFTDKQDRARTASGKGGSDVTYAYWKVLYDKYGKNPPPMADVFEIGHAATLRYRSGKEIRSERLDIGGGAAVASPLLIIPPNGAYQYEILDLTVDRDGAVRCYAKFIGPGVEMGVSHADWLRDKMSVRLHTPNVYVYLRRDSWFIHESDFPISYRFEVSDPPSEAAYEASRTCTAAPQQPLRKSQ